MRFELLGNLCLVHGFLCEGKGMDVVIESEKITRLSVRVGNAQLQ